MAQITVAGPFGQEAALSTAKALGDCNHSVFSRAVKDADGYDTDDRVWFVERDTDAVPSKIFGYDWTEIQAKQQGRRK